jgi:hypothetical protein
MRLNIEGEIAELVLNTLYKHIEQIKVTENQLIIISDMQFKTLKAIYDKLIETSNSTFRVDTFELPTINVDNREIIPYLINEKDPTAIRSQAFAGKLRNSMENSGDLVRWLVIIGEPEEVEIDTFTTTGYWLIKDINKKKSYFDLLFDKFIQDTSHVNDDIRNSVKDLRASLFLKPLNEENLTILLNYLVKVKAKGNNNKAMSLSLNELGLFPSNNEDSVKPYNLKRNSEFCNEFRSQLDKLEDIDYWIEENVLEEERVNFRNLLKTNRGNTIDIIENMSNSIVLENVINIDEPEQSPIHFVKKTGIQFVEGASNFIPGNSSVIEIKDFLMKIKYEFTRLPIENIENIGLSINDEQCIILSDFNNKEGEVELDISSLGILEAMDEQRIYKWTIGLIDPQKPTLIKKNGTGGKINRFDFYVYPNFVNRGWNPYEINEGFDLKNKQCVFNWNEQLTILISGNTNDLSFELKVEVDSIENNDEDSNFEDNQNELVIPLEYNEQTQIIIGTTELKQIRKHVFRDSGGKLEDIQVDVNITDNKSNTFILSFIVGAETELPSITVNSVQEGIIRFLHKENKKNMQKDLPVPNVSTSYEIKILGGGGNQIRFKLFDPSDETENSEIYSIPYPTLFSDIEKEFLKNPLDPFPRIYDSANRKIIKKIHSNWDESFSDAINTQFKIFLNSRETLFNLLLSKNKSYRGLISIDLVDFEKEINEYLEQFNNLLNIISENNIREQFTGLILIDTLFTNEDQTLLIAPTHPLKIKAALQLQQHIRDLGELDNTTDKYAYTFGNIQLWNHQQSPPFIKIKDIYYKAVTSSFLFWGVYELNASDSSLFDEGNILSLFTVAQGKSVTKQPAFTNAISNRIELFIQSYPFLEQNKLPLTINCFLNNESAYVIEAVYRLAKDKENITWKLNFIIQDSYDMHINKNFLRKKITEFREKVFESDGNSHILRNIDYSIQIINLEECKTEDIPYAHMTLLSNLFETDITPRPVNSFIPAIKHNSLTAIPRTFFAYEENSYYTGLTISNSNNPYEKVLGKFMSVIASHDLPYQDGVSLFSRTNIQPKEMEKIDKIVKRSIWVCFLEREIGIEKFDTQSNNNHYLVDYLNKYSSKIEGYDLLTITHNRSDIVSIIKNHLLREKYNLDNSTKIAKELLEAINCLSGRWAMRLIGGGISEISGIIGSLQVFLFYKNIIRAFEPIFNDELKIISVLIPLDEYMGVSPRKTNGWFEENKEENFKSCSDDFMLVQIKEENGKIDISGKIIEVKFNKDKTSGPIISKAKEQIYNAGKILENRFIKKKYNQTFNLSEFGDLLHFHVMKFMRNNVYGNSTATKDKLTDFMCYVYKNIIQGKTNINFSYNEEGQRLIGEVICVNPSVQHPVGYEVSTSDNRRIIFLYDTIVSSLYDEEEYMSSKFIRLRNMLNLNGVAQVSIGKENIEVQEQQNTEYDELYPNTNESNLRNLDGQVSQENKMVNNETVDTIEETIPPIHLVNPGDLIIGSSSNGEKINIPEKVLTKHVAVIGSTGSGKTRLAKSIVEEVARNGIPSLIIDPQGDIARLVEFGDIQTEEAKEFYKKAEVRIFTPASNKGIQFSFNPIQMPREDVLNGIDDPFEREEYLITVFDSISSNLLSVLSKQDDQVHAFLVMVLEKLYKMGQTNVTIETLAQNIYNNQHFPLEMDDNEIEMYISKSSKQNLVRELNTLRIGTNKALFNMGFKFDIDQILKPVNPGKVPINIVYLNSLDTDQKKQFCVSVICNEMYKWMLKNPSSDLQLAFYIDEVGPYMPPQNVKKPASKDILMRLYKESRKYGIGCIFCTQNPGDVDSKILNNANTWCIGKIIPKHFDSIKKLINDSGTKEIPSISEVSNFQSGEFLILSNEAFPEDKFKKVMVRDLYTHHKSPYTLEELEEVTPAEFKRFFSNQ